MLPSGGRHLSDDVVTEIGSSAILAPDSSEEQPSAEPEPVVKLEPEPAENVGEASCKPKPKHSKTVRFSLPSDCEQIPPIDKDWLRDYIRYMRDDMIESIKRSKEVVEPEQVETDLTEYYEMEDLKTKLVTSNFSSESCLELVTSSDYTFESILGVVGSDLEIETFEHIVGNVFAKKEEGSLTTTDNAKFKSIAEHTIYPKLMNDTRLRAIYPYYEKIVQVDPAIATDKILLPLIQEGRSLNRTFLLGIDLADLTEKILRWMVDKNVALDKNLVLVLNNTTEYTFPTGRSVEYLLTVFEQSFKKGPKEPFTGSFFYRFVRQFLNSMEMDHLKRALEINRDNETMLAESSKKLLDCQLARMEEQWRAK